jgi:polysaccharide pyruvyl transferase WcaK-like protein
MKPIRILFYGNFGAGNLGNECTLQAAIEQTLQRWPEARLECLCTVPEDVRARHGITAWRSVSKPLEWTWESLQSSPGASLADAAPPRRSGLPVRALRTLFRRIPSEIAHWVRCFRIVRGADLLVVPGTQIVSDYLCGPFGWPYDIFKFSSLAALSRVKLVFLSVGVGPVRHPLSRWFIKRSLGLAAYRSYRDEASRGYMQNLGFDTAHDAVFPDLVFGLAGAHFESGAGRQGGRPVIGLGLKDYSGPSGGIGTEPYRAYLRAMVRFVQWLAAQGYTIRLLIGDVQYDTQVREDLVAMLRESAPDTAPLPVVAEPALTVPELLRQLGESAAVISPRFHNLILALMLGKPVIALSDHAKLDSLLEELGLADYLVPLDHLDPDGLIARFRELQGDAERLQSYIRQAVDQYRAALERQMAAL